LAKGQAGEVTTSSAIPGCKAKVVGSEIVVTTWVGAGDFDTNVLPFIRDAVKHANDNA